MKAKDPEMFLPARMTDGGADKSAQSFRYSVSVSFLGLE